MESGRPSYRLFGRWSFPEIARFTRHSLPFGPSITVPGLAYLLLRLSALEASIAPPTAGSNLPSADFCDTIGMNRFTPSHEFVTCRRSPAV
ncbi:MAG: hypothetical protein ABSF15_29210, partial [Candidatus Sulfotelmatobacter sp.]